jgi:succinate-acetate transporter protein
MPPRNWLALAALWTLGATWLGLVGTFVYAVVSDNDPSEGIGWTLLGVGTFGFVLALGGITMIRTHGETALAIAALILALALTGLVNPFFLGYGFGGLGD